MHIFKTIAGPHYVGTVLDERKERKREEGERLRGTEEGRGILASPCQLDTAEQRNLNQIVLWASLGGILLVK